MRLSKRLKDTAAQPDELVEEILDKLEDLIAQLKAKGVI